MAGDSIDLTAFRGSHRILSVTIPWHCVCAPFMPRVWHCIHFRGGDPASVEWSLAQHSQIWMQTVLHIYMLWPTKRCPIRWLYVGIFILALNKIIRIMFCKYASLVMFFNLSPFSALSCHLNTVPTSVSSDNGSIKRFLRRCTQCHTINVTKSVRPILCCASDLMGWAVDP